MDHLDMTEPDTSAEVELTFNDFETLDEFKMYLNDTLYKTYLQLRDHFKDQCMNVLNKKSDILIYQSFKKQFGGRIIKNS